MVVNNPNNWHWVDKNCLPWAKEYFSEKLVGTSGEIDAQTVQIDKVTSVEGDVVVSQRKGKIISLFDVKLSLGFVGKVGDAEAKGSITVPEVAYDTEEDEYQFELSVFSENSENTKIREVIRQKLIPKLRKSIAQFGKDLMVSHGQDIQISADKVTSQFTKANQEQSLQGTETTKSSTVTTKSAAPSAPSETTSAATATATSGHVPKYNTTTLHFKPEFNTTAEQLYITLLEKQRIGAWTRSLPDFKPEMMTEGTEFSLFGGGVSGKITKLIPNKKIEQEWRLKDWKAGHNATLTIDLHQGDSETQLDVLFKGVPIGQEEVVQGNFEDYYVRSIKITFGFGAVL